MTALQIAALVAELAKQLVTFSEIQQRVAKGEAVTKEETALALSAMQSRLRSASDRIQAL